MTVSTGDILLSNGFQFNIWTKDGELSALYFLHPYGQDECGCIIDKHLVQELWPLSTSPISCRFCGLKGLVVDGEWYGD